MIGVKRKVHFVGVGGIGMSGLAEILLNLGYPVSGSDLQASDITQRLSSRGLRFFEGHDSAHLEDTSILVVSAAVPEENPEVASARRRGIPVLHRSDLLAHLMRMKTHAVAVGGTHGKTTTTSMISSVLDTANIGATTIVGGILHRSGTNARWGTGEYLVAEADEHDHSFLRLHPTVAVVTNIDSEHLENYEGIEDIKDAFSAFCDLVPFYGFSILCGDDAHCREIIERVECVCLTYGLDIGVSLQGVNVTLCPHDKSRPKTDQFDKLCTQFDVVSQDERFGQLGTLGNIRINAIGDHNVRNALAACAVGLCLGLRFPVIAEGLSHFDGVRRRLQVHGNRRGVTVVEDYAHHPTEIANTIAAVRWVEPKRIICIFQPHLYTRTQFFHQEFADVLESVDKTFVTDIYPSREQPIPGVDTGLILGSVRPERRDKVVHVPDMYAVPERVAGELEAGDLVLVLGAGNINRIVEPLLRALEG